MSSSLGVTQNTASNLPVKQRLAMEFRPKSKGLLNDFPYITYSIDDEELSSNLGEVLEKTGFICQSHSSEDIEKLTQFLIYSLKKDHLILVQFHTKQGGLNIVSLLRKLKNKNPRLSFKNVVPVFMAKASSASQQKIFKLLAGFDIRFACFLEPGSPVEKNMEDVMSGLLAFHESLTKRIKTDDQEDLDISIETRKSSEAIEQYKKILANADEIMTTDPEKAIELFTEAINLNPDFDALMKRGDAYYNIRKHLEALTDYKEANRLNKGKATPYAKMSVCCFSLLRKNSEDNRPDLAKKWFDMGLKALNNAKNVVNEIKEKGIFEEDVTASMYAPIISALAQTDLRELGLEEEAAKVEDFVVGMFDNTKDVVFDNMAQDIDSQIDYATLLARKKYYKKAEEIFRDIIEKDPESVGPAFNNFAVELRKNGEYGKAFQIYMELLKHTIPDRDIVTQNLMTAGSAYGEALRKEPNLEKAVSVYENILACAPDCAEREWVLCDLAMALLEMKDNAQASSKLMEALYINNKLMQTERFKKLYGDLVILKENMMMKLS